MILVTGGCGYVGSTLVPRLAQSGQEVRVIDLQWFGNYLPQATMIHVIKKSIESLDEGDLDGIDTVIHLANIANDPSVELNPVLSWEVNVLHLVHLLELAKKVKVKNFFYASSGSVYGVKKEDRVTEDLTLMPISVYNKTKMVAERICLSYSSDFRVVCVRPATVCGYSPRMRFDVVVNLFVLQAFTLGKIKVLGGSQIRPNIHIEDMCGVYEHFITNESLRGIFNAGFENISILDIAKTIANKYGSELEIASSNDPRSYKQDSSKLINSGFLPQRSVADAIDEVWRRLSEGSLIDDENWHTVATMRNLGLAKE